jgi:hypothetical protein
MAKTYKIVEDSKKKRRLKIALFSTVLIAYLLAFFDYDGKIIAFFMGAWALVNFYSGFFISTFNEAGTISLSSKEIIINSRTYDLSEIEKLIFRFTQFQGEAHGGMLIGVGSMAPKEGRYNYVKIKRNDAPEEEYEFLIHYLRDAQVMYKYAQHYKNSGVEIEFHAKKKQLI